MKQDKNISAIIYASYFDFIDEADTTDQDIADFTRALREYVRGNFEYISPNKAIRAELRQIRLEMKLRAGKYAEKVEQLRINGAKGGEMVREALLSVQAFKEAEKRQMTLDFGNFEAEELQPAEAQSDRGANAPQMAGKCQTPQKPASGNSNHLLASNRPSSSKPLLEANRASGTLETAKNEPQQANNLLSEADNKSLSAETILEANINTKCVEKLQPAEAQSDRGANAPQMAGKCPPYSLSLSLSSSLAPSFPHEGREAQGFLTFEEIKSSWANTAALAIPSGIANNQARLIRWRCTDPEARPLILAEAGRLAAAGLSAEALGLALGDVLNKYGKAASHKPMSFAGFKLCEELRGIEARHPQQAPRIWARFAEAYQKQAAGADPEKVLQKLFGKAQHLAKVGMGDEKPEQVHNLTAFLKA